MLNGQVAIATELLARGANPNTADDYHRAALFAAIELRNANRGTLLFGDGRDPLEQLGAMLDRGAAPMLERRAGLRGIPEAALVADQGVVAGVELGLERLRVALLEQRRVVVGRVTVDVDDVRRRLAVVAARARLIRIEDTRRLDAPFLGAEEAYEATDS